MRHRALRAALVASLAALLVPLEAQDAAAASTCEYDAGSHRVDVHIEPSSSPQLAVDGSDQIVMSSFGFLPCGDATTTNTDLIVVSADPAPSSFQTFTILGSAAFAPGFTNPESSGEPEIEFEIAMNDGSDTVNIIGGSSTDVLRFGADGGNLNDDDDVDITFVGSTPESTDVFAGGGDDVISGTGSGVAGSTPYLGSLELSGSGGDDTLIGGSAGDTFDDSSSSGLGADAMTGGLGSDRLQYTSRTADLEISLDGLANDGDPSLNAGVGEGDNVADDIEVIGGGSGSDTITGGPNNDNFSGGGGGDEIDGGGGNDTLSGDAGADTLDGGPGADFLIPGSGTDADTLIGGDDTDSASYGNRPADLVVTLDGVANDGDPTANGGTGENDNVMTESVSTSTGNDQITGNAQNNVFNASDGNDVLIGADGDDTLFGGSFGNTGSDTLIGGPGADTLDGGSGTDTVDYSDSAAAVTVNLTTLTASGGDAQGDIICGTVGCGILATSTIENIVGSADAFGDALTGDSQTNALDGRAGPDLLDAAGGNDLLIGGPDGDKLDGNAGTDTASYAASSVGVVVDLNTPSAAGGDADGDTICTNALPGCTGVGPSRIENLTGSAQPDVLSGDAAVNALIGLAGDDTLAGLGGGDQLDGGVGPNDTLDYSASPAGVSVDLSTDTVSGGHAEGDAVSSIESVTGSDSADELIGDVNENALDGLGGDDKLVQGAAADAADSLVGGDGSDTVTYAARTTPVAATIGGLGGAAGESDSIALDVEVLVGGSANDRLVGDDSANTLNGRAGNDLLDGKLGADVMNGGTGTDLAIYAGRSRRVVADPGGSGDDGTKGEGDTIASNVENIRGGNADDVLGGNASANTLVGGRGSDRLSGRGRSDRLLGGIGRDRADGGRGRDRCVAEAESSCEH